ncbi:GIY-YIG nuclease family protein [Lentilactobacillus sp. SPB1-3]|uniref:GIY-YIG nuclease family protein n=1 Tax=Lentilactobacillus terminaliae TaxID=3003483 RepID=A0ACD5DCH0_9LACO|nr:GIY-YIG nuclease family protein [Lentilactobacillus sp. SPB1-3]MCZ0977322.1 GIY-YIG nuclease family protein [Lentilactobacillus sp. SPB1-3]
MENDKKFYMYVLLCEDDTLYTGYTDDVIRRFEVHQSGKGAKYTKAHKPIKILYSEEFSTKHDAMSAEYHFKKMNRQKKISYIRNHS